MNIFPSFLPAPGRLYLPGCAVAAGLLAVSAPVLASPLTPNPAISTPSHSEISSETPRPLQIGKTEKIPLPKGWDYRIVEGFTHVLSTHQGETLAVKALATGTVAIRLFAPDGRVQWIHLAIQAAPHARLQTAPNFQIVDRAPGAGAIPVRQTPTPQAPSVVASPTSEQAPNANLGAATTGGSALGGVGATQFGINGLPLPNTNASGNAGAGFGNPIFGAPLLPTLGSAPNAPALPALEAEPKRAATPTRVNSGGGSATPQISPILPPPLPAARASVGYSTTAQLPRGAGAGGSRQGIDVTQGMARLLSFPNNVLAVFFSNPSAMDARAINARTIAVTGIGAGASTLAVFTSQFPGDAVGRANIYRIQTIARGGQTSVPIRNAATVGRAITLALGDPRVRASIIKLEDGSLAARLAGTVRNQAEVQAAISTASFYVPRDRVISSLYADINAPTLDAVLASGSLSTTPESELQQNLRRVTGNRSIELISLPTGLAFKAEVNSAEEAQSLLRVLPSLNQQVIPFIVIRGQNAGASPYYNSTIPVLNGEDRQLTQKLHDVTGITSVYAVRASSNGLACYGNVRTRTEYNTVRRYMLAMAQSSVPAAVQGTSQGGATLRPQGFEGPNLPSYDVSGGYLRALGLQMFVRITDAGQSVIRKVTVETNIVEISRTTLQNLGVQYGTASVLTQTVTPGTQFSPALLQRTIDPSFQQGTALGGTGFIGGESFGNINPFRARLDALVNNGQARVLSRPNVSAIEGAAAQITIGGERPVPKAVATQGAVGSQIEFRRFGVIISMRPTVTGDNTILLQIRADVTAPDRTFEINVGGALIPGETVRSVDTTINVRPGDTVVMGGLITNEKRQQLSKVPILGDLPVIGSLFRSRRFDNNETELAIFLTPRIEAMPADMEAIEELNRVPALPILPGRQESNGILFQDSTRSVG